MKTKIIIIFALFALVFGCKKEDDVTPSADMKVPSEENLGVQESTIPDSAIALLEKITSSKSQYSNARIGDRSSRGSVSSVIGYPDRLRISGIVIGELCPKNLLRGDREFGGGPYIKSNVSLYVSGNSLWAWVTFRAEETKSDRSTVDFAGWVFLRSIDCKSILKVYSGTSSSVSYRGANSGGEFGGCHDGGIENHTPNYGSLVNRFNIIGDTGGNDISNDDNCDCDTKIYTIKLNPIIISVAH